MRLHYYRFPEGVDDATRAAHGAEDIENTCEIDTERYNELIRPTANCPHKNPTINSCRNCEYLKCVKAEDIIYGISVSYAKQLLTKFGGEAWTQHIDRDGGCYEVTAIELKSNNSKFNYNHHL